MYVSLFCTRTRARKEFRSKLLSLNACRHSYQGNRYIKPICQWDGSLQVMEAAIVRKQYSCSTYRSQLFVVKGQDKTVEELLNINTAADCHTYTELIKMNDISTAKRLRLVNDNLNKIGGETMNSNSVKRTLHVEAVGVSKAVPDLCHILIRVASEKLSVTQAKDSVERRVAYIKQTILNCRIQESETKQFQSIHPGYTHVTELYVTTNDANKLYELAEVLTQKLDDTVSISPVSFSTSTNSLAHSRAQSASNAVQNARKKAAEMARLIEGSLGSPITLEQLGCEESSVPDISDSNVISQFGAWQQACVIMKSTVRILFELKSRK